jgi:hypothetical protein
MPEYNLPLTISDFLSHSLTITQIPAPNAPLQPLSLITVVRREDLLFLTFQFVNLGRRLLPSGDAQLERLEPGTAFIIVHFPQQSIAEQALGSIFDQFPSGAAQARVSGLSRLAFVMPPQVKSIPFNFAELMAWHNWSPSLAGTSSWPKSPHLLRTAIEAPYRLIISPVEGDSIWRHRIEIAKTDDRFELWHTRLSLPEVKAGQPLEARAIWARDFGDRPKETNPFRMSLTQRQRSQLVLLTSLREDAAKGQFTPAPVTVEQLMLTSLGAYLHVHGEWNLTGSSISVSEWRHRATLGRDHYVRVVDEGALFPFGHRAAFITITERRFTPQGAYLIQQMLIVVREPLRELKLDDTVLTTDGRRAGLLQPFQRVRMTTLSTPLIDIPDKGIALKPTDAFWIKVAGKEHPFHYVGEDWAGQTCEFVAPAIFVSNAVAPANTAAGGAPQVAAVINEYNANEYNAATKEPLRRVALAGRHVAFAAPSPGGTIDTSYETTSLTLEAVPTAASSGKPPLPFHPAMQRAEVRIAAVEHMTGAAAASTIKYFDDYLKNGFDLKNGLQGGEVFAELIGAGPKLNFDGQAQRSGGLFTPNFTVNGLSRKQGTVGGDLKQFNNNVFSPTSFFDGSDPKQLGSISLTQAGSDPKLLGNISLTELLAEGDMGSAPRLVTAPIYDGTADAPVAFETTFDWTPLVKLDGKGILKFKEQNALHLSVKLRTSLKGEEPVFDIKGELTNFYIDLVGAIQISFESLSFKQLAGQKMHVSATPKTPAVSFLGALEFFNNLTAFLEAAGVVPPSLDVDASGARLGYTLALPDLTVGSYALQNIKLSAALNIPFSNQPVRFRFAFGERHDPFRVTVSAVAGGGFVGIGVGADGIESIEASLEFGGNIAINLGVASGGVSIMGGFYIGSLADTLNFSAYIRACGSVEVLGLICVSIEFYLSLGYAKIDHQARLLGTATVTVEVEVVFFSKSVEVTMERTLLGSAGDPTFTQMMNRQQWKAYRQAFA